MSLDTHLGVQLSGWTKPKIAYLWKTLYLTSLMKLLNALMLCGGHTNECTGMRLVSFGDVEK
jgi:hypothetical protein